MGRGGRLLPFIVLWGLLLVALGALLVLTGGRLVFPLDDPYIHLAFAENLRAGHFGLNAGELSSPSSSILWPFLLLAVVGFPFAEWAVLFFNFACATGTLWVIGRFLQAELVAAEDRRMQRGVVVLAILSIAAGNLVGLAHTGMEHSLQVLLATLLVLGVVLSRREGRSPGWLVAVVVVGPLVRYETLALSLAAVLWWWWSGERRQAIVAVLLLGLFIGGYSLFLGSLGLPLLPTSIVAKSVIGGETHLIGAVAMNVRHNAGFPKGILTGVMVALLVWLGLARKSQASDRRLALCFALALFLHLGLGRFGAYHRYGIYAWLAGLLVSVHLLAAPLRAWIARHTASRTAVVGTLFVLIGCMAHVTLPASIPRASQNIYLQQHQMHRFATEYWNEPLATNDIGRVAYRNENYILDLGGLASVAALQIHGRSGADLGELARLVTDRGIRLAMIHDSGFFGAPPEDWRKLGELHLSVPRIIPSGEVVTFYATDGDGADIIEKLEEFGRTLPRGAEFVLAVGPGR